jgi:predicted ribosomally synthesized peptide with nif11-like leader
MSQSSLNQFLAKVAGDAMLQDQLKGVTAQSSFAQVLVKIGKDNGFEFTSEDVAGTLAQSAASVPRELSDDELEQVAGGARPRATSDGCGSAWTTLFGPCR